MPTSISKAKNILDNDAESPKKSMPISNVPMAPNPVQTMYAVLTVIVLWAKYRNTPLKVMQMTAIEIQNQKRSGCVPDNLNPSGHPISKIAAVMSSNQSMIVPSVKRHLDSVECAS